jgi:NAD(P)-dependent dehydrogenase (short-subunit alcohol dehydrogenase family)
MKDQVCIVTGATSGIGKATAFGLARLGARIVMVCRNSELGKQTIDEVVRDTGNSNVEMLIADLASQQAIRKAADEFKSKHKSLSLLVNNAGYAGPRALTEDGIERTFAVNHLAYFLLTNILLDVLKTSGPARIINVSSEAHRNVKIDFNDLQMENNYSGFRAYSISKLCNVLFTYELARRLEGSAVTANALHPGFLSTGIFREAPALVRFVVRIIAGSAEKGAKAIVHLGTAPELANVSGKYFDGTKERQSSDQTYDQEVAERLWQVSTDMTGLKTAD